MIQSTVNLQNYFRNTMIIQKNILSLQAQNQTGSFVMCARLSLYFKTIYQQSSCI